MDVCFCGKTPFPINKCGMHSHGVWEIIYQVSGKTSSQIGSEAFDTSPGDIMIIPPGVMHNGKSAGVYTDMYIQAKHLDFYDINVIHDYDGHIFELFNMIHKSFLQKGANYSNICDAVLWTICQYIKKYMSANYKHAFVYELENCIYENISNSEFKISQHCKHIGYNIDYLRRSFFEDTGKTPHQYLSDLRLSLAKKLLLQDDFVSVEDISAKCGFTDSFYFSTLFKKKIGMTPSSYRKKKWTAAKNKADGKST